MKRNTTIILIALFLPVSIGALAQKSDEESPEYLLLATKRTGTMQKEVDEAAGKGYRILMGSPTSGDEMALFLRKTASPDAPYQYRVLATTKTSTMEKELNEMAGQGFRLLPSTMIAKQQMIGPVEIVVLLERAPATERKYEYKLLATTRTGTLQKEVAEVQSAGFVIVGMVSRGEHMVIAERESQSK